MADFKVDENYKEYRRKQRRAESRRNNIFITVLVLMLLALAGIGIFGLIAANRSEGSQNTPQLTAEKTESGNKDGQTDETRKTDTTADPEKTGWNKKTDVPVTIPPTADETPDNTKVVRHLTTIYVDAGHGAESYSGAHDVGAGEGTLYNELTKSDDCPGGKYEDDLNLEMALILKRILTERGYNVVMTRESEVKKYVSLTDRASAANDCGAEVFVSIHANTSSSSSASGARIFYYKTRSDAEACKKLADSMKSFIDSASDDNALLKASQKPTQVNEEDYEVLRKTTMPAVLVESCFLTNGVDAENAADPKWQEIFIKAIADGIEKLYPPKITYQ